MTFEPVVPNPDLWINPSPEGLWSRVAVCSRWADAEAVAARWNYRPAVVGPLRTEAGLDLVVRSLLANPQIRVVFVDGPDQRPTNGTKEQIESLFDRGDTSFLAEDIADLAKLLLRAPELVVDGVTGFGAPAVRWTGSEGAETRDMVEDLHRSWLRTDSPRKGGLLTYMVDLSDDRPGGRHVLLPPRPVVTDAAPHGDPGDRVAGNLLSEVYVRALHQVMTAGRLVPTQYGATRELLDLVTVIRDPARSLEEFGEGKHPVLGMSGEDLQAYTYGEDGFLGTKRPEQAPYAYGQRMRGSDDVSTVRSQLSVISRELSEEASALPKDDFGVGHLDEHLADLAERVWIFADAVHPDQVSLVVQLLKEKPDTRAAYVSPWWPDEDAGKESGRPCLVGAWFRAVNEPSGEPAGPWVERDGRLTRYWSTDPVRMAADIGAPVEGTGFARGLWMWDRDGEFLGGGPFSEGDTDESMKERADKKLAEAVYRQTLHLTVSFRSHDLLAAYPQNLGACCRWLVDVASSLGWLVGTVTCVSMSAHVYDHSWGKAEALWAKYRRKGIRWDGRSAFRVEKVPDPSKPAPEVVVGSTCEKLLELGAKILLEVTAVRPPGDGFDFPVVSARAVRWTSPEGEVHDRDEASWFEAPEHVRHRWRGPLTYSVRQWLEMVGWKPSMLLRAVATVPGTARVIGVFEASSGSALRIKLEDSGLLQELGSAMWLGAEIERVEQS